MNSGHCDHRGDVHVEHRVSDDRVLGRCLIVTAKCVECGASLTFDGLPRVRDGLAAFASPDGRAATLPVSQGPNLRLYAG